jgi:polysaccharide biosynthesis/export protein
LLWRLPSSKRRLSISRVERRQTTLSQADEDFCKPINAKAILNKDMRTILPEDRLNTPVIWRHILGLTILVVASSLLGSCQYPATGPLPEQMAAPTQVSLTSGDVIKFTFSGAPELNQSQKIRTDGKINLPLIGEVDAAGKTIGALQSEISLRYKPQLQNTTVVLTLESSVTQVVVSGAVSKAGKLSFERPTTVVQAIMEAGGVTEFGTLKKVHLIRIINGQQHTQILDLSSLMRGQPSRPFYVRDGDVIYVPQSPF